MSTLRKSFGTVSRCVVSATAISVGALSFPPATPAKAAQLSSPAAPRIVEQIDESRLTRLHGNVPMLAKAEYDQGEASPSTELTHIRLVLSRSPERQAAVDKFTAELQDKSSPNYHKWLTPEQIGQLFGPADSDIAALVAWLQSHGLTLERVSSARTNIAFSGTVRQVEEAFHTSIHSFQAGGDQFYSNTTDPSIPAALTAIVSGVAHLNTIRPIPHHAGGHLGIMDPESHRLVPANPLQSKAIHPNLTTGSSSAGYTLYVVPGDAATIYDTPNTTFNANYTSGTNYTGAGVTIGIGGDSGILAGTIVDYRTKFLGDTSTTPITITNVDGVAENSDSDEAYIDTELSGGLAPGANIHYYASTDLLTGIQQAIDDNTVDIFSLSFGACELNLGDANNSYLNGLWQQAFIQGIAVTVSTGDSGSAGCDRNQDNAGNNVPDATKGLQINGFASTPYTVAVGGTDFAGLINTFTTYAATSSTSANFYRSALSYIPESTWNNSTVSDGLISANSPFTGTNANIEGGGGGKSSCVTTDTKTGACVSGYAKPSWQRGTGVPADSVRDIPDISLMSGNGADSSSWLVCTDGTGTVGTVTVTANCTKQADGNFYFFGFGGTSTAAPAFAGILALVQQKTGGRLGQAAAELYDLYNGSNASTIFHDTTVGNNSVACISGSTNCVKNTAGNYFESGYDTTAGYDLATGIGSVDVKQLISYWGTAIGAGAATVKVVPSATNVTVNQSFTVDATVTGSSSLGTPSGTATLSAGSYTAPAQTLTSGLATFTVPAGSLVDGSNTVTVTYNGDTYYATATGSATVTVPAPIVSLSPPSLTFPSTTVGVAATAQIITVTNTGTAPLIISSVTITGTNASSYSQTSTGCTTVAVNGTCTISVGFTPTTFGTLTGSISIADNAPGSPQTVSLSGTAVEAGSFTLAASAVTVAPGASGSSTVTATGVSGYFGTITLSCALTASPAGTAAADLPTCTPGSAISIAAGGTTATGTVTINTVGASSAAVKKLAESNEHRVIGRWLGGGTLAIACVLLLGIPARKRNLRSFSVVVLTIVGLGVLYGCGGSSHKQAPTVTTGAASSVSPTAATIAGTVNPNGTDTTYTFSYGTSSTLSGASTTASQDAGSGKTAASVSANLSSLTSNTTYFYQLNGTNSAGNASGSILSFKTGDTGTPAGTYTFTVTGTDAAGVKQTTTLTVTVS